MDEIKWILNAPVSSVRLATDEEKQVFSNTAWLEKYGSTSVLDDAFFSYSKPIKETRELDKEKGWFLTFGLESGQNFVGYIPKSGYHYYRFHTLNRMVPHLREIVWDYVVRDYDMSDYVTRLHFMGKAPEDEALKAYSFLIPPYRMFPDLEPQKDLSGRIRKDPSLMEMAKKVQKAYREVVAAKENLISAQQKLNDYLIPSGEKKISSKTNKQIQQKLKERRQNG